jgi:hypothetical protein
VITACLSVNYLKWFEQMPVKHWAIVVISLLGLVLRKNYPFSGSWDERHDYFA